MALCLLLAVLAVETAVFYPNYLAYFNGIVRPREAYRHLVDSSLDWGQDLRALKAYLDRYPPAGQVYLSYSGNGSPKYYGVQARILYSPDLKDPLRTSFAIVSLAAAGSDAQMLRILRTMSDYDLMDSRVMATTSTVTSSPTPGASVCKPAFTASARRCCNRSATRSKALGVRGMRATKPPTRIFAPRCNHAGGNPDVRLAAWPHRPPEEWGKIITEYERYRFARLTAWLRDANPTTKSTTPFFSTA